MRFNFHKFPHFFNQLSFFSFKKTGFINLLFICHAYFFYKYVCFVVINIIIILHLKIIFKFNLELPLNFNFYDNLHLVLIIGIVNLDPINLNFPTLN